MNNYELASAFCLALSQNNPDEIFDFRAIHDQDKGVPAIPRRGTLAQCWQELCGWNAAGYGIFCTINRLDGNGHHLPNVQEIRAHFVDLDNLNAAENLQRANNWQPAPSFAVQSSPNKFHIYWPVAPYLGNERFTTVQRKLFQTFEGDKTVIDASRVMRLPGTYHRKGEPQLVTCFTLSGYGYITPVESFEHALQHVNVMDFTGTRKELGDADLTAPSLPWLQTALRFLDPNSLTREEWISFSAAFKQAGWNHADEQTLFSIWSDWCGQYEENDPAENLKQWNSIRDTQLGWKSITRRLPELQAHYQHAQRVAQQQAPQAVTEGAQPIGVDTVPPMPVDPSGGVDLTGELLTAQEQKEWFKGCFFIESMGKILTSNGRFMQPQAFNGSYGGKKFIVDETGKVINEAWQAATRSTLWTIPKADHIRFLPHEERGAIVLDALGRRGVNTYRPALIKREKGDVSPFLRHMQMVIPNDNDRKIILDFMAHNAKFPGYKIPWAPLIQSAEGVGKGVIKAIMKHVVGGPYFHPPNAKEMVESGSKFNAWMRSKLFILVDEIKVDERRDMIEVLKPMISEKEIEIQGKGIDQDKEDNYSNWCFFSNYKNAIPINANGRRFAIFYSAIQSLKDLERLGMGENYFDWLYGWLGENDHENGLKIVADYLYNYPIERGEIPMRAPVTSSTKEALRQSRGPIEEIIFNSIEDNLPGFRGGWVSVAAVVNRVRQAGGKPVSPKTIETILEQIGYKNIGRSERTYFTEDPANRSQLFHEYGTAQVHEYGTAQGYT